MCGIFGAIGNYDIEKIRFLSVLNETRGRDSFGLYDGRTMYKSLRLPRDSLNAPKLNEPLTPFIMGHTRKASIGAVNIKNAHPFKVESIIGAHNGTLSNFWDLKQRYKGMLDEVFEVDSQIIFWGLFKYGLDFLKELEGTWAISFFDQDDPLFFNLGCHRQSLGMAKTEGAIYYSSAREDLERVGLKAVEVPNDTLAKINLETLEVTDEVLDIKDNGTAYKYAGRGRVNDDYKDWEPPEDSLICGYSAETGYGHHYPLVVEKEEKKAEQSRFPFEKPFLLPEPSKSHCASILTLPPPASSIPEKIAEEKEKEAPELAEYLEEYLDNQLTPDK